MAHSLEPRTRHCWSGAGQENTSRAPRLPSGCRPRSAGASEARDCARRHGSDSAYGHSPGPAAMSGAYHPGPGCERRSARPVPPVCAWPACPLLSAAACGCCKPPCVPPHHRASARRLGAGVRQSGSSTDLRPGPSDRARVIALIGHALGGIIRRGRCTHARQVALRRVQGAGQRGRVALIGRSPRLPPPPRCPDQPHARACRPDVSCRPSCARSARRDRSR